MTDDHKLRWQISAQQEGKGVRVRMEDQKREKMVWSASKVLIAVAVVASVAVTSD